jgi:hypothetical protein
VKTANQGSAWRAGLLVLLTALACEKAKEPAAEQAGEEADPLRVVLARVGDEVVTVEDLGFVPVRVNVVNKLETLVMRKLAAEEARRRGLEKEPRTREKMAQFRHNAVMWEEGLLRNALYNSIRLGLTLTEEELRTHFEQTQSRYTEPQWKLRLQKFASEAEARDAGAKLGATGRLDPAQGELVGPLPAAQLPPPLMGALPLLKQPGDRQVVDLSGSWTLVELEEFAPNAPISYEVARERVDADLRAVRADVLLNAELGKLRAEQVTIDQQALAKLEQERAALAASLAERRAQQANPPVLPEGAEPTPPAEPAPGQTP